MLSAIDHIADNIKMILLSQIDLGEDAVESVHIPVNVRQYVSHIDPWSIDG